MRKSYTPREVLHLVVRVGLIINLAFAVLASVTAPIGIIIVASLSGDIGRTLLVGSVIFLIVLCYLAISLSLYKFTDNLIKRKYFIAQNGRLLQLIGGVCVLLAATFIYNQYIVMRLVAPVFEYTMTDESARGFAYISIVIGFIFLLIAEAFVQGNKLQQEHELTV